MEGYEGISVVVSVFNQAGNLRPLYQAVARQMEGLGRCCEFVFVDDGSDDDAMDVLRELAAEDTRVRALRLSRCFGVTAAVTAGLNHCRGAAVLVIDACLEHPAETIPQMVAAWRKGAHVVRTADRTTSAHAWLPPGPWPWPWPWPSSWRWPSSSSSSWPWPSSSSAAKDPHQADGDGRSDAFLFGLLDRAVVDALLSMPEHARSLGDMLDWLGYRETKLPYRPTRRPAETSRSPSDSRPTPAQRPPRPRTPAALRIATTLGLMASLASLLVCGYTVCADRLAGEAFPVWLSTSSAIVFLGGVQLTGFGLLGRYLGGLHAEVQGRPLYVVSESIGLDRPRRRADQPIAILGFPSVSPFRRRVTRGKVPHP